MPDGRTRIPRHSTPVGERAPQVGQVWRWWNGTGKPLRITRIAEAGWFGVELGDPEEFEWLLHWRQIEAGRYVRDRGLES